MITYTYYSNQRFYITPPPHARSNQYQISSHYKKVCACNERLKVMSLDSLTLTGSLFHKVLAIYENDLWRHFKLKWVKATWNTPWDRHTFICLLLQRISIEMPHAQMNKKKAENMQTIMSFLSNKTHAVWLIKSNYQPHKHLQLFLRNSTGINCWL